ncbi:Uncharacterized protein TSPI_08703 [Trichinella spiralis]|uniref:Uncharacterized protein n=1 Tax=Trichinella spiralis TaxID=6334 RepID=A0ABR3KP74_TRISP
MPRDNVLIRCMLEKTTMHRTFFELPEICRGTAHPSGYLQAVFWLVESDKCLSIAGCLSFYLLSVVLVIRAFRRNVEFGRGKLTVLNAPENDASLSSAAKLEELRDSMIALMDTDATLLKQMEALREAIENLKTVSLEEFPGKRYFSRQNSVLRIPIPPTRLRGKRFSPGELGLAAKMQQRPLSDASFTSSSSKGQEDAHEKGIACNESPVKITTTYAESLAVNHDCQSSFDSGIHLTHNDDKEDFYIYLIYAEVML